jgi:hypothetical protein
LENETNGEIETVILNAPSLDYLEEFTAYPKEDLKIIGVISVQALLRVNILKTLKQDSRILLIDPQECLTIRELVKKYTNMGFLVIVDEPPILVRVFEPELTCETTNVEDLLANPSEYDRRRLYIAGKVSALSLPESSFFVLNEKVMIYYKYFEIDLTEQIIAEGIKNEDYVTIVGTFFQERSTLYAHRVKKVKEDHPPTLTIDKLLNNAAEYDGQTVQVFGTVTDLKYSDEATFQLDGKIKICYIHDNVDLQSQISEVEKGDPIIVTGVFHCDDMILYAEHIRPSKSTKQ